MVTSTFCFRCTKKITTLSFTYNTDSLLSLFADSAIFRRRNLPTSSHHGQSHWDDAVRDTNVFGGKTAEPQPDVKPDPSTLMLQEKGRIILLLFSICWSGMKLFPSVLLSFSAAPVELLNCFVIQTWQHLIQDQMSPRIAGVLCENQARTPTKDAGQEKLWDLQFSGYFETNYRKAVVVE